MDLDVFYFFRREAFIYKTSQTEEGRKYLQDCRRISQTGADRQAIRENLTRKES